MAWDVGLLIFVGLLLVGQDALSRGGAPTHGPAASPSAAPTAPAATPSASARPQRTSPTPLRRRSGPTRFAREEPSPAATRADPLQQLEDEFRRLMVEGERDAALATLTGADAALTARAGWSTLRDRLAESLRVGDALVAERERLEAAADRGDLAGAQAIVAGLPAAVAREPLEAEVELARARAAAAGGFDVTGFVPGETRVEGTRALVSGPVDQRQAQTLLTGVEAVLEQALRLGLTGLPSPLDVRLQAPSAPEVEAGGQRVVTVARKQDGLESLAARLRWHTAHWAVTTGAGELPAWLRTGLTRVLAGSLPGSRARPEPSPAARAWRRQFLTRKPLGDGVALQDLLASDAPDPVRAWALTWFAGYGQDPNLPPLQDLLQGRASLSLSAAVAADLERAWVDALEAW